MIEVLIVLAILSAAYAVFTPNIQHFYYTQKSFSAVREIAHNIKLARMQSLYRQIPITFCASTDNTSCSNDWSLGAIVFTDNNSNYILDNDEIIIATQDKLQSGASLKLNAVSKKYIHFTATGYPSFFGNFIYCPPNKQPQYAQQLIMNRTGRIRLATDSDNNNLIEYGTNFNGKQGQSIDCSAT